MKITIKNMIFVIFFIELETNKKHKKKLQKDDKGEI
jgi:hypothetical protein